jgi:hypothetical protein
MVAQATLTRLVMVRIHVPQPDIHMLIIRRMVDKNKSYTAIFLKGEPPRIFPTTDYEHARILQIYKQDKKYEGILNDFTDVDMVE